MSAELRLDFHCPLSKKDFTASEKGLHCPQCEKPVLDFTDKDKEYIIRELSKYKQTPCVAVPADVLSVHTVSRPFWQPFRKSAALIALFLWIGDVKTLLAQTKNKLKDKVSSPLVIPSGYQKIRLTGFIHTETGQGIPNAELVFSFFGSELGRCQTQADGHFDCSLENYGGIRELDIKISAEAYKGKELKQIQILKENPTLDASLEELDKGFVINGERPVSRYTETVGAISVIMPSFSNTLGIGARHFLGMEVMEDLLPPVYKPAPVAVTELHYPIRITDEQGNPVANARVELRFSARETRWGITDANGELSLHIQLNEPTAGADVSILADGYHGKRIWDSQLDENTPQTVPLKKKRRGVFSL